ncbi:SDR family NAD(P)-dependent oxidoreductase [Novosphingobium rosa]|uniref:SDR family NAD(P)-dependent oxidoreductase n=1 Tax=Novosphingobium rosa TaxID=76978 RepID=UPI0008335504|nr:SDR family oxidoreductase [Novosphingobium rosa]
MGKCAIVFGGSGGLGAGCVRALARDWAHIVITYRGGREKAEALAASLPETCQGWAVPCDVTDRGSVFAVVEEARARGGAIDTVVWAAGLAIEQPQIGEITEEEWRAVFDAEALGFTRVVSAVLPLYRAQQGGNFVAVTSMANTRVIVGDTISAAPKAAIEALCRGIAKEEGRFGIRANSVAPGAMNAGLGELFIAERMTPEFWEKFRKSIPLRRFGLAGDVGEAAAFFASERASYLTGQTLIVDGGYTL